MTVKEDMDNRIMTARAEGTVSGRLLAILIEEAQAKMSEEQLTREIEEK